MSKSNYISVGIDVGSTFSFISIVVTIHSPAENRGSVNSSTLCDAVAQNTDLAD